MIALGWPLTHQLVPNLANLFYSLPAYPRRQPDPQITLIVGFHDLGSYLACAVHPPLPQNGRSVRQ